MSLENHLAFAVVKSGTGNYDQVGCLLRAVYLAWLLRDASSSGDDIELFRQGGGRWKGALSAPCRVRSGRLTSANRISSDNYCRMYDAQLAVVPSHVRAWERTEWLTLQQRFANTLVDFACIRLAERSKAGLGGMI